MPPKIPVVLAPLDAGGRAVKVQLGPTTTGRKAVAAYAKSTGARAVGLRHRNRPVDLDRPLAPQCAADDVVEVVLDADAEDASEEIAEADAVAGGFVDPRLAELLKVAGPEMIATRCTGRALVRAASLEASDDEFRAAREELRKRRYLCNEELCEQRLSLLLPRGARLLTIGAGFGATSMIADVLLDRPEAQVVVDPGSGFFPEYLIAASVGSFKTAQGFLGKSRQSTDMVLGDVVERYYDLAELEALAGGPFDAVLADCEGAFGDVLDDFPRLLETATWICVEWDGAGRRGWVADVRRKLLDAGFRPLDCGDRRCTCVDASRPAYEAQGAPTFHEIFAKPGPGL